MEKLFSGESKSCYLFRLMVLIRYINRKRGDEPVMGKKKPLNPIENNWLFACPLTMITERIIAALDVTEQPIIELSAEHWSEKKQMANDILRAYGYSDQYFYKDKDRVTWNGLHDWMFIKGWKGSHFSAGRLIEGQFIGEIFVLRGSQSANRECLNLFLDIVYSYVQQIQTHLHLNPNARVAVVLAGWAEPTFESFLTKPQTKWMVNSLLESF